MAVFKLHECARRLNTLSSGATSSAVRAHLAALAAVLTAQAAEMISGVTPTIEDGLAGHPIGEGAESADTAKISRRTRRVPLNQ